MDHPDGWPAVAAKPASSVGIDAFGADADFLRVPHPIIWISKAVCNIYVVAALHLTTSSLRFLSGDVLLLSPALAFLLGRRVTPPPPPLSPEEKMSSAYSISSP